MIKKILRIPVKLYKAAKFSIDESQKRETFNKNSFVEFGEESKIEKSVSISDPTKVHIGKGCYIQGKTLINSTGGLYLEDYIAIGYNTTILTFIHNYQYSKSIPYDNINILKPVVIRSFAWIGWHSRIYPGIEIGEGAIVSMGAIVASDVPPLAIVMGNPAKVVGYRSAKNFNKCKLENKFNSPMKILENYGTFEYKIPFNIKNKFRKEIEILKL